MVSPVASDVDDTVTSIVPDAVESSTVICADSFSVYWDLSKETSTAEGVPVTNKISLSEPTPSGVVSSHMVKTLPPTSDTCGASDIPALLLIFCTGPNVVPLSSLEIIKMSLFPGVSSRHTMDIVPVSDAILGVVELPLLELRFCTTLNEEPTSVLFVNETSPLPETV